MVRFKLTDKISGRSNRVVGSIFLLCLSYFITITPTELVVNVKNQGGEVFQESIWANLSDETVHLEVEQPDGSVIVQFIDFKNGIQIINALILGEEEKRELQFQVLCFVTVFKNGEFIPLDAMAKLRQKNPWTVRVPERDMGKESISFDVLLDISSSEWISPHIINICSEAKETTYGKREELFEIVTNRSIGNLQLEAHEMYLRSVKPFPLESENCGDITDGNRPCLCKLELCIGWYPCALKYCQTHDVNGKPNSSYRCGIHTCKKCRKFNYSISRRSSCLN